RLPLPPLVVRVHRSSSRFGSWILPSLEEAVTALPLAPFLLTHYTSTGKRIGEPLQHLEAEMVKCAAFSPDGKTVVTGAGRFARFWDASTGKTKDNPLAHEGDVKALAYSPDGSCILTGSQDGVARLWEAATGKPVGESLQHRHSVWAVAYS